jgi:hypothetical protein
VKQQRIEAGRAKQAARDERLAGKRARKQTVADELARIGALTRATKFSELLNMRNDQLADQLKIYKLVLKRTGFTVTQTNREAYVRQVQSCIVDEGGVNDLPDGESGLEGVNVQRRVNEASGKEASGGKKRKAATCSWKGYVWDPKAEFEVIMLAGKRIADGCDYGDGGVRWKKGTVLYKVIWEGYPPDAATWEPPDHIEESVIEAYEDSLEYEADADAELEDEDEDTVGDASDDLATEEGGGEEEEGGGEEDEGEGEEVQLLEVTKIIGHHVAKGAKVGSLTNIYMRVEYSDGTSSGRQYMPAEPLGECEEGKAVLARYVRTKQGGKVAKYVP